MALSFDKNLSQKPTIRLLNLIIALSPNIPKDKGGDMKV